MNMMTIQASHVISTCLISYYLGADSFIDSVRHAYFPDVMFSNFNMSLAIAAFILTVLNAVIITDEEDAEGFFGKAASLSKGIIYKKTSYMHLLILLVYSFLLIVAQASGEMADQTFALLMMILIFANIFVPCYSFWLLSDPDRVKQVVGEPNDIEKKLSNKGGDVELSEAALRVDFWYLSICAMVAMGTSRMYDTNNEKLGLHNDVQAEAID